VELQHINLILKHYQNIINDVRKRLLDNRPEDVCSWNSNSESDIIWINALKKIKPIYITDFVKSNILMNSQTDDINNKVGELQKNLDELTVDYQSILEAAYNIDDR
jgi:hypothetical protein